MRFLVLALACSAISLACGERYTYASRGVEMIRVENSTGKTEVLRRDTTGKDRWVPVAETTPAPPLDAQCVAQNTGKFSPRTLAVLCASPNPNASLSPRLQAILAEDKARQ